MHNKDLVENVARHLKSAGITGTPGHPYRTAYKKGLALIYAPGNPTPIHATASAADHINELNRLAGEHLAIAAIDAVLAALPQATEQRYHALKIALHDAITRPMGVVPASAEAFYDPALATRLARENENRFLHRAEKRV